MNNSEIIDAMREKTEILNKKNCEIGEITRAIRIIEGYEQHSNKYDKKWCLGNALQIGYISEEDHKLIALIAVNAWRKTLERLEKEFNDLLNGKEE